MQGAMIDTTRVSGIPQVCTYRHARAIYGTNPETSPIFSFRLRVGCRSVTVKLHVMSMASSGVSRIPFA